jgi:hypothetical protein
MTLVHLDTEVSKRKIHDLDLSFVERRLIRVDGYTAEQARAATDLYRCVLVLQVEYPERAIVPPVAADHALHAHILHTRRYAADMQAIFGRVLHHDPDDFAAATADAAREFTRQAFLDRFGIAVPAFEMCLVSLEAGARQAA